MSTFIYRMLATIGVVALTIWVIQHLGFETPTWAMIVLGGITGIALGVLDDASMRRRQARAERRNA